MCAPYTPLVFRQLVLSQFGQRDVCGGGEERRQEMTAAPLTSPLRPEERGDRERTEAHCAAPSSTTRCGFKENLMY